MKWPAITLAFLALSGCRTENIESNERPTHEAQVENNTPSDHLPFSKALGIDPETATIMDFSSTQNDLGQEILRIARRHEQTPYGRGEGQYVCVSFVEQVLLELGIYTNDTFQRRIYNSRGIPIRWENRTFDNPDVDGIAMALVAEGYADPVIPWTDAEPGDFAQIWRDYGKRGHAAIVEENHLDINSPSYIAPFQGFDYGPYLLLYGASSYPGQGKCKGRTRGCVTSARSKNLFEPSVKVMVARLRPDAVGF